MQPWSGEALLFLFSLVFLELISNICPNWCWVFVGHDLGQVQPLIFWNKICLQLMLNICSNWCWVLLVVILVRCSPFSFQHDFSWIRFKYLCQLMSSICWSWSWSGAGCSSPPPAHQSPKTCPQETATAPFASPVFFLQSFFLQIFTFSPASSITQKNKCCPIILVVREGALCPRVYYVQKLRAISDVPLVIFLARVQI